MLKQIYLMIFVPILIDQIAGESPCGDWLSYRDEKCFTVIDSVTTEAEAGSICQKQLNGTFGIIRSAEEQDLVYDYLKEKNLADNVWIGLKKVNNLFKAIDGSISKYSNWNTGRPTNQSGFDCVEMLVDYQGKWSDVKCEKKNAILCEKNQEWSNSKIEIILQELRRNYSDKFTSFENKFEIQKNESQSLKNEIAHLKQNPVPIGFIYVQLPEQSEPHTLWPNAQWDNISKNYSGLFFRAEGSGSNEFGKIQEHQTQSIDMKNDFCKHPEDCSWPSDGQSDVRTITKVYQKVLYTGSNDGNAYGIRFKYNSEEIRPRNQAIRIWIRIK